MASVSIDAMYNKKIIGFWTTVVDHPYIHTRDCNSMSSCA